MRYRRSWALATAAVAVAALLTLGPPVRADFEVIISDGTKTQTFADNATNDPLGAGKGVINFTFTDGANTVTGTASAPGTGSSSNLSSAELTQSSVTVSLAAGNTLTIKEVVNNLSMATAPGTMTSTLSNSAIGGVGAKDSFQSFIDSSNTFSPGVGANPTGTQGPLSTIGTDSASAQSPSGIGTTQFAISNILTFNAGSTTSTLSSTGTTEVFNAPAPAGLTLAFSGLLCGLPLVWLRRQKVVPMAV